MKIIFTALLIIIYNYTHSQTGQAISATVAAGAITYLSAENTDKKRLAKEISHFRAKEYIIDHIIGPTDGKSIKFEAESLASDNSGGLISVAFNCNEVDQRGLLLAFFGEVRNSLGVLTTAYAFRYIPLSEAQNLMGRINKLKDDGKDYMVGDKDVNNIYIEHKDIKFVLYKEGGEQIRVFWNGFEVIWEKTAFNRSERRLNKWFD